MCGPAARITDRPLHKALAVSGNFIEYLMKFYTFLSITILLSKSAIGCKNNASHLAGIDTIKNRITCTDTLSTKIRSGFYLIISEAKNQTGIQLYNQSNYYILDSVPILSLLNLDTTFNEFDSSSRMSVITIKFNESGSQIFGRFTTENKNRYVGIIVCNKLISVAKIIDPIFHGVTSIIGYSRTETDDIIQMLNAEKRNALEEYLKNYR